MSSYCEGRSVAAIGAGCIAVSADRVAGAITLQVRLRALQCRRLRRLQAHIPSTTLPCSHGGVVGSDDCRCNLVDMLRFEQGMKRHGHLAFRNILGMG